MSSTITQKKWTVKSDGPQVVSLRQQLRLPVEAADKLLQETSEILSLCGPPDIPTSAETGLALGFVQSGKTMSFTSLIAMARDNGYQIIIVLAGTQNVLVQQSQERLTKDLQIKGINSRDWRIVTNPSINSGLDLIRDTLGEYKSGKSAYRTKRTSIVVVTKNTTQLEKLIGAIEHLDGELKGVPTLIVDDEADQAGMNTEARANRSRQDTGQPTQLSPVYSRLLRLKHALPHHTYVQYTATPQAPLFISRQDDLSPNFIKLLTPGEGYTGGDSFFNPPLFRKLVKRIPPTEVPSARRRLDTPPSSLQEALRLFFLGVAEHLITKPSIRNRSMMVHPSQRTDMHSEYYNWVGTLKVTWTRLLSKDEEDADRQALVEEFRTTYNELYALNNKIPSFETHLEALYDAIDATRVTLLNATPSSALGIEWHSHDYFILVGGQVLSRGFTVEGLTVTYMPRSLGGGTADTIQQWARFFGYKKSYIHLCRIYLVDTVISAFRGYVQHETDLRTRLTPFDGGSQLNSFQRRVELPSALTHLTRRNVMSDDVERYSFGGSWVTTETVQGTVAEIEANRKALQAFISNQSYSWQLDEGEPDRSESQKHKTVDVPLTDIIKLLRSYTYLSTSEVNSLGYTYLSTDDANTFDMLADNLEKYSRERPKVTGAVYRISPDGPIRVRTAKDGKLAQGALFGSNPAKQKGRIIYPGDKAIRDIDRFSVQIWSLRVNNSDGSSYDSFVLAVWVPAEAANEMVKLAND